MDKENTYEGEDGSEYMPVDSKDIELKPTVGKNKYKRDEFLIKIFGEHGMISGLVTTDRIFGIDRRGKVYHITHIPTCESPVDVTFRKLNTAKVFVEILLDKEGLDWSVNFRKGETREEKVASFKEWLCDPTINTSDLYDRKDDDETLRNFIGWMQRVGRNLQLMEYLKLSMKDKRKIQETDIEEEIKKDGK